MTKAMVFASAAIIGIALLSCPAGAQGTTQTHTYTPTIKAMRPRKVSPVANQSMSNKLPFLARVRIWKDERWISLKTVDDAIDFVQELPNELRSSSQWRRVQQLLFFADETRDRIDVVAAHCALIAAVQAEGWWCKDRSDRINEISLSCVPRYMEKLALLPL